MLFPGTNDDNVHYMNSAALMTCLTESQTRFESRAFINKESWNQRKRSKGVALCKDVAIHQNELTEIIVFSPWWIQ
jgi:predicted SprT family Zn-dependent metalloprotease